MTVSVGVDNSEMPGLMIVAHAPLASSLKSVAEHAYPDCALGLEALDVLPGMSIDDVEAQAREMLGRVCDPEAIVFTDVFGATPCNAAQRLDNGTTVRVIAGINVAMLWRSLCYRSEPLEAVVVRALAGAKAGVMTVTSYKPQNQGPKGSGGDSSNHHDQ